MLSIPSFGGGIALEGSSDVQRTDELRAADSYDIGPRGQLVATSDLSPFEGNMQDGASHALTQLYGIFAAQIQQGSFLVGVGDYSGTTYLATLSLDAGSAGATPSYRAAPTGGLIVTFATLPFVGADNIQKRVILVNLGARAGQNPIEAAGLFAIVYDSTGPSYALLPISRYDALGTGLNGEFPGGTHGQQMCPRGIIIYNNFAWAWGWDAHDSAGAANQDGPNRLMFSNLGNPLKWGNDPTPPPAVETDRVFNDTDAFNVGGAGSSIRASCVWDSKLFVGTSEGLHYVSGFGRESFLTNGALPVMESKNTIGPHALVEGPDRLLHGVSDEGHWIFSGGVTQTPGDRLRDFKKKSNGYWDLIWSDPTAATGFPGKTNQDLVWMLSVPYLRQVWIVIPYCSIANGYGAGSDTVIIKYHCDTGGYTRQTFVGKILTHGMIYIRDQTAVAQLLIAAPGQTVNLQRYGYQATLSASPPLCSALPDVTFGEYAPHGPDGVGVSRRVYATISWESSTALLLVFSITPSIDGESAAPIVLTIAPSAPGSPSDGDVWVDTSGTDTNLGNGTAGAFTPAHPADFLVKRWVATWAKWIYTGDGGEQGKRITVAVPFVPERGTRVTYRMQCTSASCRYQFETLGLEPATIRANR